MIVRWLGAFRKVGSLSSSLEFEFSNTREIACEYCSGFSAITHANVGLIVANRAMVKKFSGDVWSKDINGRLVPTRWSHASSSKHTECFCKPIFKAIVIKSKISAENMQILKDFSKKTHIPIVNFYKSKNKKREIIG